MMILDGFTQLQLHLQHANMRHCVVLSGTPKWQENVLILAINQHKKNSPSHTFSGFHIISNPNDRPNAPFTTALHPKQARHQLGQETDFVIFDAKQGIDPNTLGIVSGMIRAGGLCWICLPPEQQWLQHPNPACQAYLSSPNTLLNAQRGYNAVLFHQLMAQAIWVNEGKPFPSLLSLTAQKYIKPIKPTPSTPIKPNAEQTTAIKLIERVALGHRNRPLLLTAERGRGKSTLIGLAVVQLINQGKKHIVLSAMRKDQLNAAFEVINAAGVSEDAVRYIPPDQLLENPPTHVDMVIIDEAAQCPLPMLSALVNQFSRIVFSTTLAGYEGTGNGFKIKFADLLSQHRPQWKDCHLLTPIRWQAGDYLENLLHSVLFSQTRDTVKAKEAPLIANTKPTIRYQSVSTSHLGLLKNAPRLKQLYQLMLNAHYQTSPNDLMHWLESPDIYIIIAVQANTNEQEKIVGALIATKEGALLNDLDKAGLIGRKQGHLFPQLMFKHTNDLAWLGDIGFRVLRIAVSDTARRLNIGSQLMTRLKNYANTQRATTLSASFGVQAQLLSFWMVNGFKPCGLGIKKDKASGAHSISCCLPLSQPAHQRVERSVEQFFGQFNHLLLNEFQALSPLLVLTILAHTESKKITLNTHVHPVFPKGYLSHQPFEAVSYALRAWCLGNIDMLLKLSENQQAIIVQKVLQNKPWQQIIAGNATGRKQLNTLLLSTFKELMRLSAK